MHLHTIQVHTVAQTVIDRILDLISEGRVEPGEKLPPQRELARMLGVGLSSLREALQSLQSLGLIEVKRGKGTFVSHDLAVGLAHQVSLSVLIRGQIAQDFFELRAILEGNLVALAATRATPADLQELEGLLGEMEESIRQRDLVRLNKLDVQFHATLADAAHNSLVSILVTRLHDVLAQRVRFVDPFSRQNFQYHRDVYQAIKDRDPERAGAAMETLLEDSWERIEPLFASDSPPVSS